MPTDQTDPVAAPDPDPDPVDVRPDEQPMIVIDDDWLVEVGLGQLPRPHRSAMISYLMELIEIKVGGELSTEMSDSELEEFEVLTDAGDDERALQWLQDHRPDYKNVVRKQVAALRAAVKANADRLVGISLAHWNSSPDEDA